MLQPSRSKLSERFPAVPVKTHPTHRSLGLANEHHRPVTTCTSMAPTVPKDRKQTLLPGTRAVINPPCRYPKDSEAPLAHPQRRGWGGWLPWHQFPRQISTRSFRAFPCQVGTTVRSQLDLILQWLPQWNGLEPTRQIQLHPTSQGIFITLSLHFTTPRLPLGNRGGGSAFLAPSLTHGTN